MHTQAQVDWPRVVIVGGGFGGLHAARALGSAPVRVTLIDRNNHHLFQPLLYQVATAALSPADITAPIRHVVRSQKNTEVLLAEVTAVNRAQRTVTMRDMSSGQERGIEYDYLVLATGAGESYFGHANWETYAPGLKSIADATAIRRKVLTAFEAAEAAMHLDPNDPETRALLTFVIIGGGPTGVELAGALADLSHKALASDFRHINPASARIVLVEAEPRLLGTFAPSLSGRAARELRHLGVEVRTGARVTDVDADGVEIGDERIAAKTVIWAAGVRGSPAGEWLGAEMDRAGRVIVRPDLSVPGAPEVFVLGDTAHYVEGAHLLPGVAQVAMQQGDYVATVIRARVAGESAPRPFHYRDKGMLATVGRTYAIADIGPFKLGGFLAWLIWLGVHIWFLIGFRNRVLVLIQWAWAYLTYQRGARLIWSEEQPATERVPVAVRR